MLSNLFPFLCQIIWDSWMVCCSIGNLLPCLGPEDDVIAHKLIFRFRLYMRNFKFSIYNCRKPLTRYQADISSLPLPVKMEKCKEILRQVVPSIYMSTVHVLLFCFSGYGYEALFAKQDYTVFC